MARGPVPVEVRPETAPDGTLNVLLQLPNGYVLMNPQGARDVAERLIQTCVEIEGS